MAGRSSSCTGVISGGTRCNCSPLMPSGSRLVASRARCGQPRSSASASLAHASITCSQLSSTSSRLRWPIASASVSATGRPVSAWMLSTLATVPATSPGSVTGARSANQTPSPEPSSSPAAACSASRVFPEPPGPVSVTSREVVISWDTSASSVSRPMKLEACTGKLLGSCGLSSDRSGGNAPGSPGASSWKICSGRLRSFSRCMPRSRRLAPPGSASPSRALAAAETRICPPCATAATRAPRCTSIPTSPVAPCSTSPEWMPIRTRSLSPPGQECAAIACWIATAAAAHLRAVVNTAKNASPWVSTSRPPCLAIASRISR